MWDGDNFRDTLKKYLTTSSEPTVWDGDKAKEETD